MKTVIKYLWKSLWDKKVQTLLVLFSIAAASSLIFANQGFQRTCEYMFYEADTRHAGTADYLVMPKDDGAGISEASIESLVEDARYAYVAPFIKTEVLYAPSVEDMYYFSAYGADLDLFMQYNPFALVEGNMGSLEGYQVIVGSTYAEQYNLHAGDQMALEVNGVSYPFTIVGIAEKKGVFLRELADGGTMIMPLHTLREMSGLTPNLIYVRDREGADLKAGLKSLQDQLPDADVALAVDTELIQAETSTYAMPFNISAIAVIFMSLFILHTGFSMISLSRISSIGILRSLGITKRKMNGLLVAESAVFGTAGGVLGCFLGVMVLNLIKSLYFSNGDNFAMSAPMIFGIREILYTIAAAIIISVLCAIAPIVSLSKKTLKDIMLHNPEKKVNGKSKGWVAGALFMMLSIILAGRYALTLTGMILGCIIVCMALIGLILLTPALIRLAGYLAIRLGVSREVSLGIRNVSDNKVLSNNFRLFAAMIAIVAFMVSIFATLSHDLHDAYETKYLYHATMELKEPLEGDLERLLAVDGVTDAAPYNLCYESMETGSGTFINGLFGIQDIGFFDFNAVVGLEGAKDAIARLNDGNYIVTTTILQSKFGFQLGDTMNLRYKNHEMAFTITGFVDTNYGIGHVAYLSQDNFAKLTGDEDFHYYAMQGDVPQKQLKISVKREFTKNILAINTRKEQEKANADKVDSIFQAINCYTYFAVLIGIIGMINNIVSGYLERKRSLALYRCIGMSRTGMSKMIATEAAVIGILGSVLGVLTAIVMMQNIPSLVGMMWGNVTIHPANVEIVVMSLAGALALLAVSIVPMRSSSKISILESMRYE